MIVLLCITLILSGIAAKKISPNIVYNGPFNPDIQVPHRRLVTDSSASENVKFFHGIASGDATDTDLLIWTRVTPPFQDKYALDRTDIYNETELISLKVEYQTIMVDYIISTSIDWINFDCGDELCGSAQTSFDIDYTLKVIIDGLAPNTWYYYQFRVGNATSDIGRTRTIPSSDSEVNSWRFAFGSCKQITWGYWNNLADIAERDDLDMVVWLGDYIYEFPTTSLVNGTSYGRIPFPDTYLYNLSHYRGRYLQHHLEKPLQDIHKKFGWYMIWDDHEIVNNYWKDGAPSRWQIDSLYGVDFEHRRLNAYQAFFEWTPVRTLDVDARGGLYKSYKFGDLFDLIMIDTRSQRTEPAENVTYGSTLSVDEHYAFGEEQRNWLLNEFNTSKSRGSEWRLIASNDIWGQSPPKEVFNGEELYGEDKLEGYDRERQIILDYIIDNDINNVISLAGGPHTGIAQKVFSTGKPIADDADSYPIMSEFTVDAICAPKLFEDTVFLPYIDDYFDEWSWVSPYFRLLMDGYSIMTINKNKVKVDYWINDNIKTNTTKSILDRSICVIHGTVQFVDCNATLTTNQPTTVSPIATNEKSLKFEIIIVIIVAILIFIAFSVCIIWYCCKCRKNKHQLTQIPTEEKDEFQRGTPDGDNDKTVEMGINF